MKRRFRPKPIKAVRPAKNKHSPLHLAAEFISDVDVFRAIVESVADINIKDSSGETPLHKLLSRQSFPLEMLNILVEKGADVHMDDNESQRQSASSLPFEF